MKKWLIRKLGGYTHDDVVSVRLFECFRADIIDLLNNHASNGHVRISGVRNLLSKYTKKVLEG